MKENQEPYLLSTMMLFNSKKVKDKWGLRWFLNNEHTVPDDTIVEKCAIFCIDPIGRKRINSRQNKKKKLFRGVLYSLAKSYLVKRAQACEEQITI
jgi:hypothetical protein